MEVLRDMHLPPGFGFHPSDIELVSHYLKRKILGQKIEYDLIPEVDIYKHEPWDLPAKCNLPIKDNKWHFFASRDRKYPTGSRSNRATLAGYWKSTGKDRAIKLNKLTLGTKKTLVFHEGRPPSGRRTEWIMHEYYIDENGCKVSPDMKDAFVLCRVTKRNDWSLDNDNEVGNRSSHLEQPDAATSVVSTVKPEDVAASVICPEESNHATTPIGSAELSNDVAQAAITPAAITPDSTTPNGGNELETWLQELLDPSPPFNLVADTGSADVCPTEQYAESSNLQNPGSMAPNIRPGHASPIQDGTDATDYLFTDDLPEDLYSMLYPGTDQFNDSIFLEQTGQEGNNNQTNYMMGIGSYVLPNNFENETPNAELQLDHENNKMDMSNENNDTGITIRRRRATAPPANISLAAGKIKMQVGIKRMVTSNSESINQTMKFTDNSGRRLDLRTDVEHQKKNANNVISAKQSDAANHEAHSNQGYLEGFKRCSSAGFRAYIFVALFVVGVAALVLHYHRSNANL
ncbi:NAC domain-containing protein 74 [Zea mays]|eukprot:XP_008673881.1 NAC domain-containing protein 74 [Zea mays]